MPGPAFPIPDVRPLEKRRTPHPLRTARQALGVSGDELAEASGVSRNVIYGLESYAQFRVYVDDLYRLGQALGLEWPSLAGTENLQPPSKPRRKVRKRNP